ncbi:MAG TPA: hypothetical protein VNM89_04770 [Solirubrobacterales bacterium]|nr:hypothetical protein [Solirubrobacterales bacterium]
MDQVGVELPDSCTGTAIDEWASEVEAVDVEAEFALGSESQRLEVALNQDEALVARIG